MSRNPLIPFGEAYVRYESSVSEIVPMFWKPYRQEEGRA